jgi:hypothetical protein
MVDLRGKDQEGIGKDWLKKRCLYGYFAPLVATNA